MPNDSSDRDWEAVRVDEIDDPGFRLLYDLAVDLWGRELTVARRQRDRALVLVRRVESDADGILKTDSESRSWLVPDPWDSDEGYAVVVELDAPRGAP